jgi:hypothetical protein
VVAAEDARRLLDTVDCKDVGRYGIVAIEAGQRIDHGDRHPA